MDEPTRKPPTVNQIVANLTAENNTLRARVAAKEQIIADMGVHLGELRADLAAARSWSAAWKAAAKQHRQWEWQHEQTIADYRARVECPPAKEINIGPGYAECLQDNERLLIQLGELRARVAELEAQVNQAFDCRNGALLAHHKSLDRIAELEAASAVTDVALHNLPVRVRELEEENAGLLTTYDSIIAGQNEYIMGLESALQEIAGRPMVEILYCNKDDLPGYEDGYKYAREWCRRLANRALKSRKE